MHRFAPLARVAAASAFVSLAGMRGRHFVGLAGILLVGGIFAWGWLRPDTRTVREHATAPPQLRNEAPVVKSPRRKAPAPGELEWQQVLVSLAPRLDLESGELPWEARVRAVLEDEKLDESQKSRELLRSIPTLPEEALESVTEHAVSELRDADYAAARTLLINPQTHGRVLGVLFADLMERPDAIAFPTLLAIARNASHPFAPAAQDALELVLSAEFGEDWPQWEAEIRNALAEQPSEAP